jgi:hypothetical protein
MPCGRRSRAVYNTSICTNQSPAKKLYSQGYLIWSKPKLNTPPRIDVGACHRTIRSEEKGAAPEMPTDIRANHLLANGKTKDADEGGTENASRSGPVTGQSSRRHSEHQLTRAALRVHYRTVIAKTYRSCQN